MIQAAIAPCHPSYRIELGPRTNEVPLCRASSSTSQREVQESTPPAHASIRPNASCPTFSVGTKVRAAASPS